MNEEAMTDEPRDVPLRILRKLAHAKVEEAGAWAALEALLADATEIDRLIITRRNDLAAAETDLEAARSRVIAATAEAEEVAAKARREADRILAAARLEREEAGNMRAEAESRLDEAAAKAAQIVADAEATRQRVNAKVDEMRRAL
jgi:hypothetical protein